MNAICPICDSGLTETFLYRKKVPVHQNLVMSNKQSAINIDIGNLTLSFCQNCGFVFNQDFDQSKLIYGQEYDNTQTHSPAFDHYTSDLAQLLIYKKNVQNCSIVEVGCGKGSFLRKLVECEQWQNTGYGFDPSYIGSETDFEGRLKFYKCYYDENYTHINADIVVCRHVIEHIPNPIALIKTLRKALMNSPKARVFFETPCVDWILENLVIWDFFYEHCSYFNADSLQTAFELSGFEVKSIDYVFAGQYLWLEAIPSKNTIKAISKPKFIHSLVEKFAKSERELITYWKTKIQDLLAKGKVAIWGAGAKGVTLANLVDKDAKLIDCVIDINPNKQGKYIPGTGHPIVSYQDIGHRGIKTAILMNPNYRDENLSLLKEQKFQVELIS